VTPIASALSSAEPGMPAGLNDRAEDVWESLIAVADAAGGDWPARARAAAVKLSGEAEDNAAESVLVRLLSDMREVFGESDSLWTRTILGRLHDIPEAPWGDWYGKPLNDRGLRTPDIGRRIMQCRGGT
jgi:uncharacterized protein DUF3631